jgi:hypothetical protein
VPVLAEAEGKQCAVINSLTWRHLPKQQRRTFGNDADRSAFAKLCRVDLERFQL